MARAWWAGHGLWASHPPRLIRDNPQEPHGLRTAMVYGETPLATVTAELAARMLFGADYAGRRARCGSGSGCSAAPGMCLPDGHKMTISRA